MPSIPDDIFFASISEINQKLKAREFSAVELTRAFMDRLERLGPRYNALALKALMTLDLNGDATQAKIKARYKDLVKRHHPDANGGDRSSEDKLREIIQAYNYLRSNKLV